MLLNVTEIENAMIARLRERLPYLRSCDSLAAFMSRDIDRIEEVSPLCPAAYVVYAGGAYEHKTALSRTMTFSVIVMVSNLRSNQAVLHGQSGEKGVYDLLQDVRAALAGQTFDLPITPLLPVSESAAAGELQIAIYGIDFKTTNR